MDIKNYAQIMSHSSASIHVGSKGRWDKWEQVFECGALEPPSMGCSLTLYIVDRSINDSPSTDEEYFVCCTPCSSPS